MTCTDTIYYDKHTPLKDGCVLRGGKRKKGERESRKRERERKQKERERKQKERKRDRKQEREREKTEALLG